MYELCLPLSPYHSRCIFELAKLLHYHSHDFKNSKIRFNKCLKLDSDKACVWFHTAIYLESQGELHAANHSFKTALRLSQDDPFMYMRYADFLVRHFNNKDEGMEYAQMAMDLDWACNEKYQDLHTFINQSHDHIKQKLIIYNVDTLIYHKQ